MINDCSTKFVTPKQNMSFSQTCNLLSHFVKENRSFCIPSSLDAPRGVEGYNRSTMNLFPVKQTEELNGSVGRTINLFPQISGFNSSTKKRSSPEPSAAQMTIFYGGKVVVLDDMPADKALEVMKLASRFESSVKMRKVESPAGPVPVSVPVPKANPVSIPTQTHVGHVAPSVPVGSVPRAGNGHIWLNNVVGVFRKKNTNLNDFDYNIN
ncbi:hypothetical protein RND81_08G033200 [Saponaria officinalis]|uniref:Protein TIFY n=1 Tax=Saponaria officinalis TaxID=3572 RepID=A0AAW1J3U1_SAPOF